MKTEIQKCLKGEFFNTSDRQIQSIIHEARRLTKCYNELPSTDFEKRNTILKQLLGSIGNNVNIDTPFYCDYGKHISIGNNVIININCTFVDCNKIDIGNNVLIASNVQIYTATHPVEVRERLRTNWNNDPEIPFLNRFPVNKRQLQYFSDMMVYFDKHHTFRKNIFKC